MNGDGALTIKLTCPACGSNEFIAFNGRDNARCARCGSMERTRLLWMVLEKFDLFQMGQRILHIAPELALTKCFTELSGDRYHGCDIDPSRYSSRFATIRPIDLCADLAKMPSRSFDLIIHTHVLEHIACDVENALQEMERLLAPGGHHFFSVPIRGEITREDISEDLTPQHRALMFGQEDHLRIFGAKSLVEMLSRVWGDAENPLVTPRELFSEEELSIAAIPPVAWSGYSSHSIFHHVRTIVGRAHSPPASASRRRAMEKPAEPCATGQKRLLLNIGMPGAHCLPIQRWTSEQHAELSASSVACWRHPDREKLVFMGFASDRRVASGDLPFARTLKQGGGLPTREAAREALQTFLETLDGHIGYIDAVSLWSFTADEVQSLQAQLSAWGVETHVLCVVYKPDAYLTGLIERQARVAGLALSDLGVGVVRKLHFSYARLTAWAEAFGDRQFSICDAADAPISRISGLLLKIGAKPIDSPGEANVSSKAASLTSIKALLALNEALRKNGETSPRYASLLTSALASVEGQRFVPPETLSSRMQSLLTREHTLLYDRLGLSFTERETERMDDHRFLYWTPEEVGELLSTINAMLLEQEAKK